MAKPALTVHRLELFLAVLGEGGVGRGAKARNISQPAVSAVLQGRAPHFGVPLLERHGRRVRPTPAARLLEPYARQAVGLLRGAEQAAADLRGLRFFFQAEGGIRDYKVTGVQTCALPI